MQEPNDLDSFEDVKDELTENTISKVALGLGVLVVVLFIIAIFVLSI
jgi:hypothetical protein